MLFTLAFLCQNGTQNLQVAISMLKFSAHFKSQVSWGTTTISLRKKSQVATPTKKPGGSLCDQDVGLQTFYCCLWWHSRSASGMQNGCFQNSGTSKSSILIGVSLINHPFWGTTIVGNTQMLFFGVAMNSVFFFFKLEGCDEWTFLCIFLLR